MTYDSRLIANYFLKKASDVRKTSCSKSYYLASLELQKLVTISHGYHYLFTEELLISGELTIGDFEPYFDDLATVLTNFGDGPIDVFITNGSAKDVFNNAGEKIPSIHFLESEEYTLDYVWDGFFTNKLRCADLAHFTRGNINDWKTELAKLISGGAKYYNVVDLAERIGVLDPSARNSPPRLVA